MEDLVTMRIRTSRRHSIPEKLVMERRREGEVEREKFRVQHCSAPSHAPPPERSPLHMHLSAFRVTDVLSLKLAQEGTTLTAISFTGPSLKPLLVS